MVWGGSSNFFGGDGAGGGCVLPYVAVKGEAICHHFEVIY